MSVTQTALDELTSHWSISALGEADLRTAERLANERLAHHAVGQQILFEFVADREDSHRDAQRIEAEDALLDRVAFAYELAAIEGLEALASPTGDVGSLREQAVAASCKAFEFRRLFPVPQEDFERIFFVLRLSALAYCGDRWSDLRRWYDDHQDSLVAPSAADTSWDTRVLYRLFECWIRLFRKKDWDDLDRVREIIAGLRDDQQEYEARQFEGGSDLENSAIALRLVALYHWAKGTEILARYMLQGDTADPMASLDKHFEAAVKAATALGDAGLDVLLRWLHATGHVMVKISMWWAVRRVNSKTSEFVWSLGRRAHQSMFQLLPPQRAALLEQGLLDPAKTAIVVELPTSGGKTLLAQFRILQTLNQFRESKGWVAYVAPTRALCAQIARRLRRDFEPIGIRIEQLTSAVEVDAFEDELLREEDAFDVLVATPEKLSLAIRNKRISRPLALLVMDEAHNLEAAGRGLRIELFLATVKRDCPDAHFLLLMPFVEKTDDVAKWLAHDANAGKVISLGSTAWRPNERILGLYRAVPDESQRAGWRLGFETLTVTPKAMHLHGTHRVGECRPIDVPRSKVLSRGEQKSLALQSGAMASVMSQRGTSIAIANTIRSVWAMARTLQNSMPVAEKHPDTKLVQDFLRTEIADNFELADMLDHGIGVHHGGLSDEARALMEWLAESGRLKVLCATTTVAQGIDFPVSSVFLASRYFPGQHRQEEMTPREFWNLAGRAGRIGHDSVGVVGLAEGQNREETIRFIRQQTGALVSRLITLLDDLAEQGQLANLSGVLWQDQWEDFRCYVAHLWAETQNLDAVLADSEQLLRSTYGYTMLRADASRREHAHALLNATREYARAVAQMPSGQVALADATGFSPEGVAKAMGGLSGLEQRLKPDDWMPETLFGEAGRIADIFGVMIQVPQLKRQLQDAIGKGDEQRVLSDITRDWVNGKQIEDIAAQYFSRSNNVADTRALTDACRAIYRAIAHGGTWGISALSAMAGANKDISDSERRRLEALPAMIYHGVRSEEGVLMRMNSVPRSVAVQIGNVYRESVPDAQARYSIGRARDFLRGMQVQDWGRVRPAAAALDGAGYQRVWRILAGEAS